MDDSARPEAPRITRVGTFRQLEILLAVARCGGVAAAAEQLHLTQPSASMQLKKLAESIGQPLYEVVGRRVKLTAAGELVAAAAADLFQRIEQLDMQLSALGGLQAGRMSISVVTSAEYFVPHILGPFCRRYPGIDVELSVGNRDEVMDRLQRNLDDLYFFSDPPRLAGIETLPFGPNKLIVIAPQDHPLTARDKLRWRDIEMEPFVLREEGSGTRRIIERHLKTHKWQIHKQRSIASNEGIKHAVLARLGLAIVPVHTLDQGDSSGLVQLNVDSFPIEESWHLVSHRNKTFSPVAATFRDFLLNEGGQMLQGGLQYWEKNRRPKLPTR